MSRLGSALSLGRMALPVLTGYGTAMGANYLSRFAHGQDLSPATYAAILGGGALAGSGKLGPAARTIATGAAVQSVPYRYIENAQKTNYGHSLFDPVELAGSLDASLREKLNGLTGEQRVAPPVAAVASEKAPADYRTLAQQAAENARQYLQKHKPLT